MKVLLRNMVLMTVVWLQLSGISFAKQVYLQDGGIIECESYWKRDGQIFVKVNRDILLEFAPSEINVAKTFHRPKKKIHQVRHKNPAGLQPTHRSAAPAAPAAASPTPADSHEPQVNQATPAVPAPAAPLAKQKLPERPVAAPAPAASVPASAAAPTAKETVPAVKDTALPDPASGTSVAATPSKAPERQGQPKSTPLPASVGLGLLVILGCLCLLIVASLWAVFEKAGQSGIKSLIPFYNLYVLMVISGKSGWWFILSLIPGIGLAFYLLAMLSLAEKFGRGPLFGIGLFLLPMVCFPLLAFGGSQYEATGEESNFTFSEEPPPAQP